MNKDYSKYINRPGCQVPDGYDPSRFPKQSATADVAIFCFADKKLQVLLIQRKKMPFQGYWAIPGGFVENNEDLPQAAERELYEETGLKGLKLYEFGAFGHPNRDPRARTITIAYLALVRKELINPRAGDDAGDYAWFPAHRPPELAFDHELILKAALNHLKQLAIFKPVIFELLPEVFLSEDLCRVCKEIFQKKISKDFVLNKMRKLGLLKKSGIDQYTFVKRNFYPGALVFLIAKRG